VKIRISIPLAIFPIVTILFLTGCTPPKPAGLSNEQVFQAVDQTLKAINARDYQNFVQGFSDEMKNAFTEEKFTSLADMLQKTSGNYVSCADTRPDLSNNQGYAVYRLVYKYDLEGVIVTVTFKIDGDKVEGLFFDSTNLRKISQ